MKASELAQKLLDDIPIFGDNEIKVSCDDIEGEIDIGAVGSLVDEKGQHFTLLVCAECDYMHGLEKHMFDGEPDYGGYPDADDDGEDYGEDWP